MSGESSNMPATDWKRELPMLAAYGVALREPTQGDVTAVAEVLTLVDASRFGIDGPVIEETARLLIQTAVNDRAAGKGFTYVVTVSSTIVGLAQVRQLEPTFQAAEWEVTLLPAARGTGIFMETARLIGSFVFGTLGTHRLEARVLENNGRAMGALRKVGAVQEGVLRRSMRRGDTYLDQLLWSILKEDWADPQTATAGLVH